ncbi:hypothetical protein [Pyrinomonas methylaliphatogenes]|jgi:K+-transporting ATPase A subunit|uniref:Uncharacterized protein n=1 Tax=Pyrinomonas methylaliphatogenes TaxID=454194 RepID=A0A0B6WXA9_9BACT|nr:hypothetical protein [Pyrinomonas methylaliphatogenes]MBX5479712.1 hypothetical protein [Pyrinomonas methylaliphatogenes]CDM65377.1 hypothetical protein PYK22_01376 [Pyrinomonas methylaliphatogenes]
MNKIGPVILGIVGIVVVYITFHLQNINGSRGWGAIGVDIVFILLTLFLLATVIWLLRSPERR